MAVKNKPKTYYVLIAHGSRDEKSNADFMGLVSRFEKKYPKRKACGAFLELAKPGIEEALIACAKSGADEIFILPLMFFLGRHAKKDIPELIRKVKANYPKIDFHYASPIADQSAFLRVLDEQAKKVERRRK